MSSRTLRSRRIVGHPTFGTQSACADLAISTLLFDMNDVLYSYDRSVAQDIEADKESALLDGLLGLRGMRALGAGCMKTLVGLES